MSQLSELLKSVWILEATNKDWETKYSNEYATSLAVGVRYE